MAWLTDQRTQTDTYTCACSTWRLTVGGTILHTFQERIHVVRRGVHVSQLCSLSGRYRSFSWEWDSAYISSPVLAEFFCRVVSISICFLLPFLTRVLLHRAVHLSDIHYLVKFSTLLREENEKSWLQKPFQQERGIRANSVFSSRGNHGKRITSLVVSLRFVCLWVHTCMCSLLIFT